MLSNEREIFYYIDDGTHIVRLVHRACASDFNVLKARTYCDAFVFVCGVLSRKLQNIISICANFRVRIHSKLIDGRIERHQR